MKVKEVVEPLTLKNYVMKALVDCPTVEKVLVYKRTNNPEIHLTEGRDYYWDVETAKFPGYLPPVSVNSEDPLFLLYTSGSTGTPKGLFILLLVTYWVLLFPLNTF